VMILFKFYTPDQIALGRRNSSINRAGSSIITVPH
jgi:hypothetical protein